MCQWAKELQLAFTNVVQHHLGENVVRCIAMDGEFPIFLFILAKIRAT